MKKTISTPKEMLTVLYLKNTTTASIRAKRYFLSLGILLFTIFGFGFQSLSYAIHVTYTTKNDNRFQGVELSYLLTSEVGDKIDQKIQYYEPSQKVTYFKKHPVQNWIIAGYEDGSVTIWSTENQQVLFQQIIHDQAMVGCYFPEITHSVNGNRNGEESVNVLRLVFITETAETIPISIIPSDEGLSIFQMGDTSSSIRIKNQPISRVLRCSEDGTLAVVQVSQDQGTSKYYLYHFVDQEVLYEFQQDLVLSEQIIFSDDGKQVYFYNGKDAIIPIQRDDSQKNAVTMDSEAIPMDIPPTHLALNQDSSMLAYAQSVTKLSGNITLHRLKEHKVDSVISNLTFPVTDLMFVNDKNLKYVDPFGSIIILLRQEESYQSTSIQPIPKQNAPFPIRLEKNNLILYSNQWIKQVVNSQTSNWYCRKGPKNPIEKTWTSSSDSDRIILADGEAFHILNLATLQLESSIYPQQEWNLESRAVLETPSTKYTYKDTENGVLYYNTSIIGFITPSQPYHRFVKAKEGLNATWASAELDQILKTRHGWVYSLKSVSARDGHEGYLLVGLDDFLKPLFQSLVPFSRNNWHGVESTGSFYIGMNASTLLTINTLNGKQASLELSKPISQTAKIESGFLNEASYFYMIVRDQSPVLVLLDASKHSTSQKDRWVLIEPDQTLDPLIAWLEPLHAKYNTNSSERGASSISVFSLATREWMNYPVYDTPESFGFLDANSLVIVFKRGIHLVDCPTGALIRSIPGDFESTALSIDTKTRQIVLSHIDQPKKKDIVITVGK